MNTKDESKIGIVNEIVKLCWEEVHNFEWNQKKVDWKLIWKVE